MFKKALLVFAMVISAFSLQASEALNINSADAATIEHKLKGVGAIKAQAIVKYRQQNGPFKSIEELVNVSGIGEKTLDKIRSQISVSKTE